MRRSGTVDVPPRSPAVEFGCATQGNDHPDFPLRVNVMRTFDIVHAHDIDAESPRRSPRLDDAAEADSPRFALTQPALLAALPYQRRKIIEYFIARGAGLIQPVLKRGIEWALADIVRNCRNYGIETVAGVGLAAAHGLRLLVICTLMHDGA
jgi:hypothetical protein